MGGNRRWFAHTRHRVWGRTATMLTALTAVMAVCAPMAVADGVTGYHFTGAIWNPRTLPATPAVGGHPLTGQPAAGHLATSGKTLRHY